VKLAKDTHNEEVDEALRKLCLALAELVTEIKNRHSTERVRTNTHLQNERNDFNHARPSAQRKSRPVLRID
jgi:hypothetical protein